MLDERQVRLEKLQRLRERGRDPYATTTDRDTIVAEALQSFEEWSSTEKRITLAGRILTIRVHGGMMFADLEDGSGRIQIALKEDEIGAEAFADFRDLLDPGDIIEAAGPLFATKRGERSLKVAGWKILAKALAPLPEKWHGLQDVETRYRRRELDLISNPEVRERFVARSKLISSLRRFLDGNGFLEVETPILQPIPGGANARPFVTHHNALDVDLYLRIAPELYLKRLIVGGYERVYEVGRCFRNEGIDHAHNPEFTMLEMYWAYADKDAYMAFIEDLLKTMLQDALGTLSIEHPDGPLDFSGAWKRLSFREAVLEETGIDVDTCKSEEDVIAAVKKKKLKIDFSHAIGLGAHLDELYKKTARTKLTGPVWVLDYPVETMPLANASPDDPTKSAIAQLVVHGVEIVKCFYHELHDPIEQRRRLMAEQSLTEQGSEEAQRLDEAFLSALEQGMPPTSGMGMGIDRLAAIITGSPSLKEVILFPTLRPIEAGKGE